MRIPEEVIESLDQNGINVSSAWLRCDVDVYNETYGDPLTQPVSLEAVTINEFRFLADAGTITIRMTDSPTSLVIYSSYVEFIEDGAGGNNGQSVAVDDVTIDWNNASQLEVKDAGISTAKIAAEAVTNAKLGLMPAGTVKGRAVAAGLGGVSDIGGADVRRIVATTWVGSRALASDIADGLVELDTTSLELSYVHGVTSSIQDQLDEISVHNNLSGLQGGVSGEYYHLTAAQATTVGALTGWATKAYTNGSTTDVAEGTNLYFTNARADARITAQKGIASGLATLDVGGKVPISQLPATAIVETFVVATQAAMLALTAQQGDVCIRTDIQTSFILKAEPASTLANWQQLLSPVDGVTSVALSAPSIFTVTGSPITASGTLAFAWNGTNSNFVLANGSTVATSSYLSAAGNPDLVAIEALAGTSGLLKKTAANTWTLDTNTYLTGNQNITLSGVVTGSGTTAITTAIADGALSIAKTSGLQTALNAKEPSLGSPATNGHVLASTTAGVRSWVPLPTIPVTSVFGRAGAVVAASGDYTTAQVTESGNLYYTDARARAAISASAPLSYSGGVVSHLATDGNLHVPATSTTNNGKALVAGSTAGSIAWTSLAISHVTSLQTTLDAKMSTASYPDLVAIEALAGTSGLLRKTAANTWSLDTASYALSSAIPAASSTTPAALGTAAVGTGTTWARADHVHAMPTAAQVGAVPSSSGVVGLTLPSSTSFASSFTQDIFGTTASGYFLREVRTSANAPSSLLGNYASGLAWKGQDTYGSLMVAYNSSDIRMSGGNGTNPIWTVDLWHTGKFTSGDLAHWDTAYAHSQIATGNPHGTTFAQLASKPTTLSGYGITDAASLASTNYGTTFESTDPFASTNRGTYDGKGGVRTWNGAGPFGSVWYNVVDVRHRNSWITNDVFGGELAWGMTAYTDRLAFRSRNAAGTPGAWSEVAVLGKDVSFNTINTTSNNAGNNIKIGDDAWIGDQWVTNGVVIKGQTDATKGYIRFGSDTNSFGYNGSRLDYGGAAEIAGMTYASGGFTVPQAVNSYFGASRITRMTDYIGMWGFSATWQFGRGNTVYSSLHTVTATFNEGIDVLGTSYLATANVNNLVAPGLSMTPTSSSLVGDGYTTLNLQPGTTTLPTPTVGRVLFLFAEQGPNGTLSITAPTGYNIHYRSSGTSTTSVAGGTALAFNSACGIAIGCAVYNANPVWRLIW